jgi:uncharacterized Tic20 family protein
MSPPDTADGPELLAERSVLGIFIHPITLFTGFFGIGILLAALVYALSGHQFTRANARNALNWHLSVFVLAVFGLVLFFAGADEGTTASGEAVALSILPEPLATIAAVVGGIALFLSGVAGLLTIVFSIAATFKAIFGSAWSYPFAPDLIGRLS